MNLPAYVLRPSVLLGFLIATTATATPHPSPESAALLDCGPRGPQVAAKDLANVLPTVHVRADAGVPDVLPRVHVTASFDAIRTAQRARNRANRSAQRPRTYR